LSRLPKPRRAETGFSTILKTAGGDGASQTVEREDFYLWKRFTIKTAVGLAFTVELAIMTPKDWRETKKELDDDVKQRHWLIMRHGRYVFAYAWLFGAVPFAGMKFRQHKLKKL